MTGQPAARAVVQPRYGEASLSDILPSALAGLGVPGAPDAFGLANGPLTDAGLVAVLMVDGLGYHLLPAARAVAPTLTDIAAGRVAGASLRPITAGFPSTTPTSLVSLGTGAAPGSHGVVGFSLNVPGSQRVLNHLNWRDDPVPHQWQPVPTQFERARAAGVSTYVINRAEFAGSGLSEAAYRGGEFVGANGVDAVAAAMIAAMAAAQPPALVYGYHPDLDKAGHLFGLDSPQWMAAAAQVDRLVTSLIDGLPAGAALIVTADHGQLDVPAHRRFDLDADPRLRDGVRLVAGEPRMRHLHVRPGALAYVIDAWRGVLGDAAWVAEREEAIAAGWFGAVPAAHMPRIGDVVVACHADYAVLATKTEPDLVARLVAMHGSATEIEMIVPFVFVRP